MSDDSFFNVYQNYTKSVSGCDSIEVLVLGLCGETFEAIVEHGKQDYNEFLKELGDAQWYVARLADVLQIKLSDIVKYAFELHEHKYKTFNVSNSKIEELCFYTKEISEHIKKYFGHGHPLVIETMKNNLINYVCATISLLRSDDDYKRVLNLNVEKLDKRYPNGFSTANSLYRKE